MFTLKHLNHSSFMLLDVFYRPRKIFDTLSGELEPRKLWLHAVIFLIAGCTGRAIIAVQHHPRYQSISETNNLLLYAVAVFFTHLSIFLISWYVGSLMISKIMPSFGGKSDHKTIRDVFIVAYTPFLLAQLLAILPVVGRLTGYAGLVYSVALFAWCTRHNNLVPKERTTGFVLVAFFIMAGISTIFIVLFLPLLRFFVPG